MDIKAYLLENSEEKYRDFQSSLIPNTNNILGVRLPIIRKLAKILLKTNNYDKILNLKTFEYLEEKLLKGIIIGHLNLPIDKHLKIIEDFVPHIDNWAICDSFCSNLKLVKSHKQKFWEFLKPYFLSDAEFKLRFAYVMLLNYFINEKYLFEIFNLIDTFNNEKYYAKMSVAWLVATCYTEFPKETEKYLKISKLDNWTFNKSIQKICESLKVTKKEKSLLKLLKR